MGGVGNEGKMKVSGGTSLVRYSRAIGEHKLEGGVSGKNGGGPRISLTLFVNNNVHPLAENIFGGKPRSESHQRNLEGGKIEPYQGGLLI